MWIKCKKILFDVFDGCGAARVMHPSSVFIAVRPCVAARPGTSAPSEGCLIAERVWVMVSEITAVLISRSSSLCTQRCGLCCRAIVQLHDSDVTRGVCLLERRQSSGPAET